MRVAVKHTAQYQQQGNQGVSDAEIFILLWKNSMVTVVDSFQMIEHFSHNSTENEINYLKQLSLDIQGGARQSEHSFFHEFC